MSRYLGKALGRFLYCSGRDYVGFGFELLFVEGKKADICTGRCRVQSKPISLEFSYLGSWIPREVISDTLMQLMKCSSLSNCLHDSFKLLCPPSSHLFPMPTSDLVHFDRMSQHSFCLQKKARLYLHKWIIDTNVCSLSRRKTSISLCGSRKPLVRGEHVTNDVADP